MAHAKMHNCRFGCTQCGLRFTSQEKLDKHFKERHENSDRPFICDMCNSSFKTPNHLRSHKTSMHTATEDKKFVCEICDRRYPFQYQLNTHMNSAHSEVRRWNQKMFNLFFLTTNFSPDSLVTSVDFGLRNFTGWKITVCGTTESWTSIHVPIVLKRWKL